MIREEDKKWIYLGVENDFYHYIKQEVSKKSFKNINTCCNYFEERMLLQLSEEIKLEYRHLSWKDIYIIIIFIYYAFILNEQYNDPFTFGILRDLTKNHREVKYIIFEISSSDKSYAKKIRKTLFCFL